MIGELLKGKRIILASASPRRSELLLHLGVPFEVWKREFREVIPESDNPITIASSLARSKADEIKHEIKPGDIAITADTIVWCDNLLMNKPGSREEAIMMLNHLSGKTHSVLTGVCLLSDISYVTFCSETMVTFKNLSADEINYYIDNFKPYDKAGAYGIQEWIGAIGVERIEGSYFNVMGLPVQRLYSELITFMRLH